MGIRPLLAARLAASSELARGGDDLVADLLARRVRRAPAHRLAQVVGGILEVAVRGAASPRRCASALGSACAIARPLVTRLHSDGSASMTIGRRLHLRRGVRAAARAVDRIEADPAGDAGQLRRREHRREPACGRSDQHDALARHRERRHRAAFEVARRNRASASPLPHRLTTLGRSGTTATTPADGERAAEIAMAHARAREAVRDDRHARRG